VIRVKVGWLFSWTPLAYLSHIKRRSHDDRFLTSQWEVLIYSSLGVPTPALLGPPQQCTCNDFVYDPFGDLQTCKKKSATSQVHDWVVYKLGALLGSVGHRVKIHNITPATRKERGDVEIKDYVVMQKPQPQATRLSPPRTLIMDYTMTHVRFGCSHLHPMGQLTNTRRSDGAPDLDATFKEVARIKIRFYRNLYLNRPDPIAFIPLGVDTTGRMYDEFIRLLFFANLKGAVGLIMVKVSPMRISIPSDLSSRTGVPLPRFIRSRRPTPLLAPSLVLFPPRSA
jgi:hypothetical protein